MPHNIRLEEIRVLVAFEDCAPSPARSVLDYLDNIEGQIETMGQDLHLRVLSVESVPATLQITPRAEG